MIRALAMILLLFAAACRDAPEPALDPVGPARVEALKAECERSGGRFSALRGAQVCLQETRDAGKQCRRAGDCQGACLARSGTCAPVTPLFGCHEVLQQDGLRITQCLD